MITEQPKLNKPVTVSRLDVGNVIALHNKRIQIVTLTSDYQKNTIAAYKVATVKDMETGEESEMKFYANQRYTRIEA